MRLLLKVLARLGLLEFYKGTINIWIDKMEFIIPISGGIGLKLANESENWFATILKRIYTIKSHALFIDIGANIGQSYIQLKAAAPNWTYLGLEPNMTCVSYVQELMTINNDLQSKIYPFALSDRSETLNLYLNTKTDTTATANQNFRPGRYNSNDTMEVVAKRFDELDSGIIPESPFYVIKLDVEGSEYKALLGMKEFLEVKKPVIICEVLDTHSEETMKSHKQHLSNLESLLFDLDYDIFQIIQKDHGSYIQGIKRIVSFEAKEWTEASLKLNDYLFIPKQNPLHLNFDLL